MSQKGVSKTIVALAIVLIAVLLIGGVYYFSLLQTQPTELKVAALTIGTFADSGWNAEHIKGLQQAAAQYSIKYTTVDGILDTDVESQVRNYADLGYNLIIMPSGFPWGDAATAVAKDYPKTYFVVNTGQTNNSKNYASIWPLEEQNSYLAGALAGLMTKSNKIAILVGESYPNTNIKANAWKLGAQAVNPAVSVDIRYVGSWDDPSTAKSLALSEIAGGVDVLQHQCGASGLGLIEAAKEKGVYAIGDVVDMNYLAPSVVISSTTENIAKMVVTSVGWVKDGTFIGDLYRPGLKEGYVDLAPYHGLVPTDVANKIAQLKQDIIDGKITVPEITS